VQTGPLKILLPTLGSAGDNRPSGLPDELSCCCPRSWTQ